MSELTASNCGCDNNGRGSSCNIIWIILLLSCLCGNNDGGCGCGGNNGIFGNLLGNDGCGGNNSCDLILILLILNCLGCGSF